MEEQKNFNVQKELEILSSAVEKAAIARDGSFLQRNPILGKMVTCPFCRQRRRFNAQKPCCNAKYITENKAIVPKVRRRKNPRLTRNRPPLFLMRQILLQLEEEPLLIGEMQDEMEGLKGIYTPRNEVKPQHLATFVEKFILRKRKKVAKKKCNQQKISRRKNRV